MGQCLSEPERRSSDSEDVFEDVDHVEVSTMWTNVHGLVHVNTCNTLIHVHVCCKSN